MADQLLKVVDIARLANCHPQSIFRLVACRRIPFFKIRGVGLRFDPDEIRRWIDGQRIGRGGAKQ